MKIHRRAGLLGAPRALLPLVFAIFLAAPSAFAQSSRVKIVGLGATNCRMFIGDIAANPTIEREYLAWAQGYMSGILVARPGTTDDGLDLNPASFPLLRQREFLKAHCASRLSDQFADAVEALYSRLGREGNI